MRYILSQQSATAEFIAPLDLEESVNRYCANINKKLKSGKTTEASFYNTLETLVDDFLINCGVINQPKRIECGAPDFIVQMNNIPIGFIEAKDLGENLDEILQTEQLERYKTSIGNLILTNYVDFFWIVEGEVKHKISIGEFKFRKVDFHEDAALRLKTFLHTFRFHDTKSIVSSQDLAKRLARSTQNIKLLIEETIEIGGPESRWLLTWLKAFQETLVSALDIEQFSDMFAQTMAYGLFTARIYHKNNIEFSRFSAAKILPKTNPFLRKLFAEFTGMAMPQTINWAVEEVIELLKKTDSNQILIEFSNNEGRQDPIFHFYETFLHEYNPETRVKMGVYYTPKPIVDFIVDCADEILIEKYNKHEGFADPNTVVLDPALGTASFLYSTIEKIRTKFVDEEKWKNHVEQNLLSRIFGFEIMMAPYAVSHLKIGNLLKEYNYNFESEKRLGVYLTNSLEASARKSDVLFSDFISDEGDQASKIKQTTPVMVVLGNPPYNVSSQNKGEWIQELIQQYKDGLNEKKINLDDDFIKFIRFSQWRIDRSGHGIVAMITNNTFLDGITHRQMRRSLLESFDEIYILNLHGSSKRTGEAGGVKDENVFDIQQGVSINFFIKRKIKAKESVVYYSEIIGDRKSKYNFLETHKFGEIDWLKFVPEEGYYFFRPQQKSEDISAYERFVKITDLMPQFSSGIQTKRDSVMVQESKEKIEEVVEGFAFKNKAELQQKYPGAKDGGGWSYQKAVLHSKSILKKSKDQRPYSSILYRPFDIKWTIVDGDNNGLVARPRFEVMKHMKEDNYGLILTRQISCPSYSHAFCTKHAIDGNTISLKTREYNYLFPLKIIDNDLLGDRLNFNEQLLEKIISGLKVKNSSRVFGKKLFGYIYGVLSCPSFGNRYFKFLKIDFPQIPITRNLKVFEEISELGNSLVKADSQMEAIDVSMCGEGNNTIQIIKWDDGEEKLFFNKTQWFSKIKKSDFEYTIGGFIVIEKWLKDRKGESCNKHLLKSLGVAVKSIRFRISIQNQLEELILNHGGWDFFEKELIDLRPASSKEQDIVLEKLRAVKKKISKINKAAI